MSYVPDESLWPSFCGAYFSQSQNHSAYFKGGVYHHHKNARARAGWIALGCPVPGIPALPLTRHCQVDRALWPMIVS